MPSDKLNLIMAGLIVDKNYYELLIVEILFMLFSFMPVCNGLKMSEYEAYWLMGFN